MVNYKKHKFIYGSPVKGVSFINRELELQTIFNRLRNGESSAIIGESHIGKTSFLLRIINPSTQKLHLGTKDTKRVFFVFKDLHDISSSFQPNDFWVDIFNSLDENSTDLSLNNLIKKVLEQPINSNSLEKFFKLISEMGYKIVLLLDEFERLLRHENFHDPAFFAQIRKLSTHVGGLVIIPASRLTITQLNELGRNLLESGSPFFNTMIEVKLKPFNDLAVNNLLDNGYPFFTIKEKLFIRKIAGRHPYLIQAMAATLVETKGDEIKAAELFYERISFHFSDIWESLTDNCRTTAIILSLLEIGGHARGQSFNFGEIENTDRFGFELIELSKLGLAEPVQNNNSNEIILDWDNLLIWRGARWAIGSHAFAWWIRDVVITQAIPLPILDTWLKQKKYRLLITEEQWQYVKETWREMPNWAISGVGGLAQALLKSITIPKA